MRTWWGGAALLAAGLLVQAAAADPAPDKGGGGVWFGGMFGKKADDKKAVAGPPAPSQAEKTLEYERQKRAYDRREKVCDRLRQIGHDTGNADLVREADVLEDLAWKVLQRHACRLLGRAAVPMDEDLSDGAPAAGVLAGEGRQAAPAVRTAGLREGNR
jgi:hypothetical protein